MEILSKNGAQYRTRLLLPAQAERFAHCLRANPRFAGVMVCHSTRAKGEANQFVTFHPSNPERLADLTQRQEDQRRAKADTEGRDYLFCLDKDGGRPFFWCLSTSGEVYEVTAYSCTCPDYQHRCQAAGIRCKHILALEAGNSEVKSGFDAQQLATEAAGTLKRPLAGWKIANADLWD